MSSGRIIDYHKKQGYKKQKLNPYDDGTEYTANKTQGAVQTANTLAKSKPFSQKGLAQLGNSIARGEEP